MVLSLTLATYNKQPNPYVYSAHSRLLKGEGLVCAVYRIVGNFRMVQNFAVFADKSAAAKIRITNFSSASYGLLVGVVSPER